MTDKHVIALPEAGENAFVRFTISDFEALQEEFGGEYVQTITSGLESDVSVLKRTAAIGIKDGDAEKAIAACSFYELAIKLADAFSLALWGLPLQEQIEKRQRENSLAELQSKITEKMAMLEIFQMVKSGEYSDLAAGLSEASKSFDNLETETPDEPEGSK